MAANSTTCHSKMHHKQKKSFFLLFIFLSVPTSLFFFFIACHGLSLICLVPDPQLSESSSIDVLLAITNKEEEEEEEKSKLAEEKTKLQPITMPFPPQYNQPNAYYPKPNTKKFSPRRTHKSRLKFLRQWHHPNSTHFSARASNFFSSSSCNPRFFMTWISSLDKFGTRELFSMESLFKSHPDACLLILSTSLDSRRGERILRPFIESGFSVAAFAPDLSFLLQRTPAGQWFSRLRSGEVDPGHVPIGQNLSNLLRLALLHKYGGVYIDTDVIVLRSVLSLKNAIGAQAVDAESGNWTRLNNAVMVFDREHPLLLEFMREFSLTFDGSKWGHNGPYLVSRVVSRVLTGAERPEFELTVLPPVAFYPVDWSRIQGLFVRPRDRRHSRWVSAKLRSIRDNSFVVHLWNRQSSRLKIEEGSIIGRIMSDCCVFCNSSTM